MKDKEVRDWQNNFYSQDKEAHIQSSSEEIDKYLENELKRFFSKKGKEFADRIKKEKEHI